MLTKQSKERLSQAIATTVLGVALVVGFGTSKASAVSLQTFNLSGTFAQRGNSSLSNGSFEGTYTVDVDRLPSTRLVNFEEWDINIRDSSGVVKDSFSSSYNGIPRPYRFNYSASLRPLLAGVLQLDFDYTGPSPSTVRQLTLYVDSNFTGTSTGRQYGVDDGVPVYGYYAQRSPSNGFTVASFKSEPVPEPFTIGGTAVAGAMGLWLKRKKQRSSQAV